MANSAIMELGRAGLFLWVLCRQPESPCEGRKSGGIKEFLRSPEIISAASVRGWKEHNLLIPTLLKIDLVTGRFSFSQRNRCVIESLLLHQKCWHSVSSPAKTLFPLHGRWGLSCQRALNTLLDELGDIVRWTYKTRASLRHLPCRFPFLWKFFILSSCDLSGGFKWSVLKTLTSFKHKSLSWRENLSVRFFWHV